MLSHGTYKLSDSAIKTPPIGLNLKSAKIKHFTVPNTKKLFLNFLFDASESPPGFIIIIFLWDKLICLSTEDVNSGLVKYVMTGSDVPEMMDSFTFDLVDRKPNRIHSNMFHIQWSMIGFQEVRMNVSETVGVVRIPVVRGGNQKQVKWF